MDTQGRSETQLHIVMIPETAKMLGFTLYLFLCNLYGEGAFFYDFSGFGGTRSTQPTETDC